MRPNTPRRIAIVETPDALGTARALSYDVLEVANRAAAALDRPTPFRVLPLQPGAARPRGLTALVIPGTGAATWPEVEAQLTSPTGRWLVQTITRAHAAGVHVATSCSGVFFAAAAGVLDGRRATTSWFLAPALAARHPRVQVDADRVLVESGACLTGGAALAHAEVMLALVERWASPTVASRTASYLLLDRRRSQRPYMMLSALAAADVRLTRAERWVRDHLSRRFSIATLATQVGMGERSFARLVERLCQLSPIGFVQRIRVDAARVLLERGLSFDAVAPQVGYSDASALRRVFRKHARTR